MKKIAFLALLTLALPLRADLRQQIESKSGWIGYSVPIAGWHSICLWDDWSSSVKDGPYVSSSHALLVGYHVGAGHIDNVRVSSPECAPLSHEVQWLEGVDPRASAGLLRRLIDGGDASLAKKAVSALALHAGTTDDLIEIAKHNSSSEVRSMTLFWIARAAGTRAASVLKDAIDNDPEDDVKKKAVFGLSQLPNEQSIPLLVELIKTGRSAAVRKNAAFWLGQKNDPRALQALEDILKQ
jgi:hypothetical protein